MKDRSLYSALAAFLGAMLILLGLIGIGALDLTAAQPPAATLLPNTFALDDAQEIDLTMPGDSATLPHFDSYVDAWSKINAKEETPLIVVCGFEGCGPCHVWEQKLRDAGLPFVVVDRERDADIFWKIVKTNRCPETVVYWKSKDQQWQGGRIIGNDAVEKVFGFLPPKYRSNGQLASSRLTNQNVPIQEVAWHPFQKAAELRSERLEARGEARANSACSGGSCASGGSEGESPRRKPLRRIGQACASCAKGGGGLLRRLFGR